MKPGDYVYGVITQANIFNNRFSNTYKTFKEKIVNIVKSNNQYMDSSGNWKSYGEEVTVYLKPYSDYDDFGDWKTEDRIARIGTDYWLIEKEAEKEAERRQKVLDNEHKEVHPNCSISPCRYKFAGGMYLWNVMIRYDDNILYIPFPQPSGRISNDEVLQKIANCNLNSKDSLKYKKEKP